MSASLAVTFSYLAVGAVGRIPAETVEASKDSNLDAELFQILVPQNGAQTEEYPSGIPKLSKAHLFRKIFQ